ncbi:MULTISPECIES: YibE/F family protein [unclassified Clostridium]|uniref:YibE/F family protein n=1 Tax=unclassified Clostridium TaxID=2614128 RepID=UPI001C8CBE31|nr:MULTISPECIES: YibE/F family protein [unclassified Clostridium]MBX9137443.1 YibE/F family protein [Clostridium sp. K12(2020)]MBX9144233.1 YibE/F family protein [Clostridium sp. K13]
MKNLKKNIIPIVGVIICSLILISLSKFIFKGGFLADKYNKGMEYYKGEVVEVLEENLQEDEFLENVQVGFQTVLVQLKDGPLKGQEYEIGNPVSRLYNIKVKEGTKVIVGCYESNGENVFTIFSYNRSNIIYILVAIFALIVIIIGGVKGVKSLVSLIFTLVCCVYLMLPLLLKGVSPIIAGILMAILSITVTLLLVSGMNKKTFTAILGTVSGVVIAGIIAYVFGKLSYLSGITMEDAESLMYIAEDTGLKITGLMFTGILVASLGAVMDVAMSISSSIFEINSINDKVTFKELFKSAMNIGKDIIGTMTNTLILAFAGGSLSVLILIYSSSMPYNKMINLDVLGTEVIQGLAGSIGIVLAVPITALIGCYLCKSNKS